MFGTNLEKTPEFIFVIDVDVIIIERIPFQYFLGLLKNLPANVEKNKRFLSSNFFCLKLKFDTFYFTYINTLYCFLFFWRKLFDTVRSC